ncbi:Mitochondrial import inner membrane translocase subunit TIM22-2 [Hibiscus syriacus]|uniref:Mitochondrial import inner membrane translocase subunit TIM22-2 n=1 Tax=Hibiscus syriacus TaxID=106335 RepID=A0A6A2YXV9_HIBSY|nr:Mitochondrial import inner membrane translocase subunit TIM22-2 [Hibiscus syriacus]
MTVVTKGEVTIDAYLLTAAGTSGGSRDWWRQWLSLGGCEEKMMVRLVKELVINAGVAGCCTGLALSFPGAPQALLRSWLTFRAFSFIMEGLNKQQPALARSFPARNESRKRPLALPLSLPLPDELRGAFSSFCKSLTFILRVYIQTPGSENTMIKVLQGIPGATFSIGPNGIARVSGNIDPGTTLKLLVKAGKHAQVYCIDSGLRNRTSERRDEGHRFLDDPHGIYWQEGSHQYYHHPYDPFPPPPRYLSQPPMALPQQAFAGEPAQYTIM